MFKGCSPCMISFAPSTSLGAFKFLGSRAGACLLALNASPRCVVQSLIPVSQSTQWMSFSKRRVARTVWVLGMKLTPLTIARSFVWPIITGLWSCKVPSEKVKSRMSGSLPPLKARSLPSLEKETPLKVSTIETIWAVFCVFKSMSQILCFPLPAWMTAA